VLADPENDCLTCACATVVNLDRPKSAIFVRPRPSMRQLSDFLGSFRVGTSRGKEKKKKRKKEKKKKRKKENNHNKSERKKC
jgi:hypothetical protein